MIAFLGIDVGTTAAKALILAEGGRVLGRGSSSYDLNRVGDDGYEQDPEALWQGAVRACRQALADAPSGVSVRALSLSGQAGTLIPVDKRGRPLRPAISWMDRRGGEYEEEVLRHFSREEIREIAGWRPGPCTSLFQLIRLRCEEPAVFERADTFLFVNGYIIDRLCGRQVTDPSSVGITGLFNLKQACWDERMLALAGIDSSRLSSLLPSGTSLGTLTPEAADVLGLESGIEVINGAHDQYCAALGAGAELEGDLLLSAGTAWVVLRVFGDPDSALASGMSASFHALADRWGGIDSAGAVGKSFSWLAEEIIARITDTPYSWIEAAVEREDPQGSDLIFVPPAAGKAQGSVSGFINLDLDHSLEQMVLSVMEGIVFSVRRLTADDDRGDAERVFMVGRPSESPVWVQLVADLFGMRVEVPGESQAAALGAALLAATGCGVIRDPGDWLQSRSGERYLPDESRFEILEEKYREYVKAVGHLTTDF